MQEAECGRASGKTVPGREKSVHTFQHAAPPGGGPAKRKKKEPKKKEQSGYIHILFKTQYNSPPVIPRYFANTPSFHSEVGNDSIVPL